MLLERCQKMQVVWKMQWHLRQLWAKLLPGHHVCGECGRFSESWPVSHFMTEESSAKNHAALHCTEQSCCQDSSGAPCDLGISFLVLQ